ncbi:MAG: alpha/beta hydrolase [Nanoarchaeota archaeon]|nr:alpha/beta hydrolase [Nanoarchaeota archaeon]
MRFEHKTYSDSGIKMHYITAGKGKPLLFLHGVLADAMAYKSVLRLLAKRHEIIAVDLPCFGKSSTPKEAWDFREFADFMNKFVASLKIKKLIVMGHSFGGGVAFCMAAKNTNIERLVLIDSAGVPVKYSKLKFAFLFSIKQSAMALIKTGRADVIARIGFRLGKGAVCHMPKLNLIMKTVKKSMQGDYKKELNRINAKTLILLGNKDEMFHEDSAEFLKKNIKNSKLILVNGGHSWCIFQPRKLEEIVLEWLNP